MDLSYCENSRDKQACLASLQSKQPRPEGLAFAILDDPNLLLTLRLQFLFFAYANVFICLFFSICVTRKWSRMR